MKTLIIEIPTNKTKKQVIDILAKNGIGVVPGLDRVKEPVKKLNKSEQAYEDKVDRNLSKMIDLADKKGTKLVSRESIMKIINKNL